MTRWQVAYRVVTGIDRSTVAERTTTVEAADEEAAATATIAWAFEHDPYVDDRIDPSVIVEWITEETD